MQKITYLKSQCMCTHIHGYIQADVNYFDAVKKYKQYADKITKPKYLNHKCY